MNKLLIFSFLLMPAKAQSFVKHNNAPAVAAKKNPIIKVYTFAFHWNYHLKTKLQKLPKPNLYITLSSDCKKYAYMKAVLKKQKFAWSTGKNKGQECKQISKEYDRLFSQINIVFIDADNNEDRIRWKIPIYFEDMLFKFYPRGDWEIFPKEDYPVLMYPTECLRWIEYQKFIYLESYYTKNPKPYYPSNIKILNLREIIPYYRKTTLNTVRFLYQKGARPQDYEVTPPPGYIYHNATSLYLLDKTVKRRQWKFENNQSIPDGWYFYETTFCIQDLDFDKIKKDFPDYEPPKLWNKPIRSLPNKVWWKKERYNFTDNIRNADMKELQKYLGGRLYKLNTGG